jgi:hypothetical protein
MLIYFAVDGGIANQMRSIAIAPDGSATVEVNGRAGTKVLPPATVEAITAQLAASGLFDRDLNYPAQGADLQRYEIRFQGATVVWFDTSAPPALQAPAAALERALRS